MAFELQVDAYDLPRSFFTKKSLRGTQMQIKWSNVTPEASILPSANPQIHA